MKCQRHVNYSRGGRRGDHAAGSGGCGGERGPGGGQPCRSQVPGCLATSGGAPAQAQAQAAAAEPSRAPFTFLPEVLYPLPVLAPLVSEKP